MRQHKDIINIGNFYDLHTGYHASFLDYFNRHFAFKPTGPKIICCLLKKSKDKFHPAKYPFYFEIHKYPDSSRYIHSAFFPVINKTPWTVDMDNYCLPLYGNACINKSLMKNLRKKYFKNPLYRETFLARIRAYSSPYCKGILFHSITGVEKAFSAFDYFNILDTPEVKAFLNKIVLAYPAMRALSNKAKIHEPPTVIFMGRDFKNKGGHIALAAFRKLIKYDPSLKLIYCGPIPERYKRRYGDLLKDITYYPGVDHNQALGLLKMSDLLILPTPFESLGITLVEAKAAGCVPITYYGKALEAMKEIIKNGTTGILIKKPKGPANEEKEAQGFFRQVVSLLKDKKRLKRMKQKSLQEVKRGKFSFNRRIIQLNKLLRSKIKDRKFSFIFKKCQTYSYSAKDYHKLISSFRKSHRIPRRILV